MKISLHLTHPLPPTTISKKIRNNRPLAALVIVACFLAGVAHAQVIVSDPVGTSTNDAGFAAQLAKTVEQYATQIKQLANEVSQYEQMLSSIEGLRSGLSLMPNQLQQITDESSYVEASCPGNSGGIMDTLTSSITSIMGGSITQQQQIVCANIVHVQIDKYNKTVLVMNQLNDFSSKFTQIENTLAGVTTMADTGRAANQAADYHNAVSTQMSDWQAQMQADDARISALQGIQDALAQKALHGSNTVLGNLVQAAALKGAFEINK